MLLLLLAALLLLPFRLAAQQVGGDSLRQSADSGVARHDSDSLPRQPLRLREITVTASPAQREAPLSNVRILPSDIVRAPATSPWDLLRQVGGVEVHEQGQGPGFAPTASIRGFSSDHSTDMALWIDGVPVNEPVNGHAEGYADWSLLLPEAIRDIEVTKGPASALFGNFALAGTVNVRTLERMQGVSGWASGGAYGRLDAGLMTGLDRDRTGAFVALRGLREDGWRPNAGYDLGQLNGRLVQQVSGSATLDLGVGLYGTGWDSPGFLTAEEFAARDYDLVADPTDGGLKRRAQERASLRIVLGPSLLLRTTAYATQGRWQLFLTIPPEGGGDEGSGSQTEEEDRRYGFGSTTALTWSLPRTELTLGTEGRFDHADYQNWLTAGRVRTDPPQALVSARQLSGGLFLETSSDLGRGFRISAGTRYDAVDTRAGDGGDRLGATKGILSPKLGVLYRLRPAANIYASLSRGFRQPDGVIEDPSIPFITAWQYETGVKLDVGPMRAALALFRLDVSDEQSFDPVQNRSTSGGRSRRQGVDLDLTGQLSSAVRLSAHATVTDARYRRLITEEGDVLSGGHVFNTARYVAAGVLELAPERAIW